MSMPTKGKHHHPSHHHHHQQQQQQQHHLQHQHVVNVNQSVVQHAPQGYSTVVATNAPRFVPHAGSEFHVPGQNYGAQPGGQVGGGGGNVGVPGGRGPPPLGGMQSIGQSPAGIPPGGPTGAQQAPSQAPAPGVQSQQPQGPAPTTTPPVHTSSPQEMGKQAHLQAQPPPPLPQGVYMSNQTRPAAQNFYSGQRQQAPRGINHRGNQGGGGAQVVSMPGVGGGGGGQGTPMFPHHSSIPVAQGMFVPGPLPLHPSHAGPHQPPVYSQIQPIQYQAQRQTHQGQPYYPTYPPIMTSNLYGFGANPQQHPAYYFAQPGPAMNLGRAGAPPVNAGAQHVGGPLAGAQGATVVQQGSIPQSSQQPQQMAPMSLPMGQSEAYSHNGGSQLSGNNTISRKNKRRKKAILDIVDPKTGKNISEEIYDDEAAIQSGESSNRETPQPQNCDMDMVADFAARVAKAATEASESGSPAPASTPEIPTSQNPPQSLPSFKIQTNPEIDNNSQCNTGPSTPTQSIPSVQSLSSQSLGSSSNAVPIDSCPVKPESKPLQLPVKEFQPRSEIKLILEEPQQIPVVVNKEIIPPQPPAPVPASPPVAVLAPAPAPVAVLEPEPKISISPPISVAQVPIDPVVVSSPIVPEAAVPAEVTSAPNPVPVAVPVPVTVPAFIPASSREPYPSFGSKNFVNSPVRRKSQNQGQGQSGTTVLSELPPSGKEQKERKTSEKSLGSRGTTPTPAQNHPEPLHPKPNGETAGDKHEPELTIKNEPQQRPADGKATQKQKNKRNPKKSDLNRKGAEKEGTDMDAFMNTAIPAKLEQETAKQEAKEPSPPKDSNKESPKEITKDIKEKDNAESKKEKELSPVPQLEKEATSEIPKEITPVRTSVSEKPPAVQNNKESFKETTPTIEVCSRAQDVCKMPVKTVAKDVVDHAQVKVEIDLESAIVAQKNEENSKVSALRAPSEEKQPPSSAPVIENQNENQPPNENDNTSQEVKSLKYTYKDDQWSPVNKTGKKVYDRDFLVDLSQDPKSKIKPLNLPDLEVVLKDAKKSSSTDTMRTQNNPMRSLLPGFATSSLNQRGPVAPNRKSQQGKPKANKSMTYVSLSLHGDVKLRETENAWKPATRLKTGDASEEQTKTDVLYKRVRGVLNKLTPQKFDTLVSQVRSLPIDTQDRLQGVINLVFEKAIDEPSFSVAYALMCKELSTIQVPGAEGNFKKLMITRCQMEFEKDNVEEIKKAVKVKEIEACTDPEKKKELQLILEEEERRARVKSVGNIRFIGELFKQGMLTAQIMHRCLGHLLKQLDEENLECLCKLLTTIGKDLEFKKQDLSQYFVKMQDIVDRKTPSKVSSRVRFMLQDVIELRMNKWVPRRDDSNPKTMDQIQKEAETERLDSHLNNTPMNTPRRDDRNNDRKRNRGGGSNDEGWSQPVGRGSRQQYSVEASKLKNKPPSMDDLQLGSKDMFKSWGRNVATAAPKTVNKFAMLEHMSSEQDKRIPLQLGGSRSTGPRDYGRSDYKSAYDGRNSRNGSQQLNSRSSSRESSLHESSRSQSMSMPPPQSLKPAPAPVSQPAPSKKPALSEEELIKKTRTILDEYLSDTNLNNAAVEIRETFGNSSFAQFVCEAINVVVEKSANARKQVSQLMTHLISKNILPLPLYLAGLGEVLETADNLTIDIPMIWVYLAELILNPIAEGAHPMSELKNTMAGLRKVGYGGKLMGELLSKLVQEKSPKWIKEKWDEAGLQWSDFVNGDREKASDVIKKYKLEFLSGGSSNSGGGSGGQLSIEQIHERLVDLLAKETFDNVCSWISVNVGTRSEDPLFIRVLVTAILEVAVEPTTGTRKLNVTTFHKLQSFIQRYVDGKPNLELQCLYAIQSYIAKLEHPSGVLLSIVQQLWDDVIISSEAFRAWENNQDPAEFEGHAVAMLSLTSFFTNLKEGDDDESSADEA